MRGRRPSFSSTVCLFTNGALFFVRLLREPRGLRPGLDRHGAPTAGLATDLFGSRSGPILFGWVFFGHQVGAALAAYGGGLLRVWLGTYHVAFTTAGLLALGAAVLVLTIRQKQGPVPTAAARHQASVHGRDCCLSIPPTTSSPLSMLAIVAILVAMWMH